MTVAAGNVPRRWPWTQLVFDREIHVIRDEFDDQDDEGGSPPIDPKVLLLYGAWRSKVWIAGTILVGTVLGLAAGAALPNVYTSHARLDYRPGKAELQNAEAAAGIEDGGLRHSVPGMENERLILDDTRVFEKIARQIGPERILATPDPTQYDDEAGVLGRMWHQFQASMVGFVHKGMEGDPKSPKAVRAAARSLQDRTKLLPVPGASIFTVSFDGYSKQDAHSTANLIVEAFVNRHQEHYSLEAAYEATTERASQAREIYNRKSQEYRDHTGICGFVDIEGQRTSVVEEISECRRSLTSLEGRLDSVTAGLAETQLQLETIDETVESESPAVFALNPLWASLNESKIEKETERALLSSDGSTLVARDTRRKLDDQILTLQRQMDDLEQMVEVAPAHVTNSVNSLYWDTLNRVHEQEAEKVSLVAEIGSTERALRKAQEMLDQIGICQDAHTRHDSEISRAKARWDRANSQADIQEALVGLGQEGKANLSVLSAPSIPLGKSGPSRVKHLAGGLGVGLVFGLFLAVLRQLLDKNVRYPETVEKSIGVRVLGVVPEASSLRRIRPGHVNVA